MKRCLSVFIVIVMLVGLVSVTPISAYTVKTCGDYDYSFTWDDNVSISKYKGSDSTVTIPSELDGVTVTEVSDFAFSGNTDIKEVIIPDTVTTLGMASFYNCSNLETISGGKNVTMIDGSCFSGTKWLEDQFKTSSFAVFNNMLIKVDKAKIDKDVVIPENIKSIGNDAFYKTDIESISFPEGLTVIGARAFDKCEKLKVLNLPESIEKIYYSAFSNCISLENITIPNGNIGDWAFASCESLKKVTISDKVKNIYYNAFFNCNNLSEIYIPDTVESIGNMAFGWYRDEEYNDLKVSGFTISGYSGTEAERYADENGFSFIALDESDYKYEILDDGTASITGYTGLRANITIPSTIAGYKVTEIGPGAFEDCATVKDVITPETITRISARAFCGCSELTKLYISSSVAEIGKAAIRFCPKLESIVVNDENAVFDSRENCNAIIETESNILIIGCNNTIVPDSVTTILDSFYGSGITDITVPDTVTYMYGNTFTECTNLKRIKLPNTIPEIRGYSFFKCKSLKSITVPESVNMIHEWVFAECSNLKSIILPHSVNTISMCAFKDCDELQDVYYSGSEEDWNKINFTNFNDPLLNANIHYNFVPAPRPFGDSNGDGEVDVDDAASIQRFLAEVSVSDGYNESASDVDSDGDITIIDTAFIQRFLADIEIPYEIGEYYYIYS